MFALEMLCCGFTMASIILIESSDVKISLWFAAIPLAMTIAYSVLLVINAKSYIHKVQKERLISVFETEKSELTELFERGILLVRRARRCN